MCLLLDIAVPPGGLPAHILETCVQSARHKKLLIACYTGTCECRVCIWTRGTNGSVIKFASMESLCLLHVGLLGGNHKLLGYRIMR